jgi:hypothetical protein
LINNALVNVTCLAGQTDWTTGIKVTMMLNGRLLKRVMVWFPPGVESQVYVRVLKVGAPLIPDTMVAVPEPARNYGDGVTGNRDITFNTETEVKRSEVIEVQYRNLDATDAHEIMVNFEFHDLPTKKSQLRS